MTQRTRLSAALLTATMIAGSALAQDQETTTLACTNAGIQYKLGEFACISACHERRRLARCDAVSEKPSWTYVEESCPTAMINAPWPSDWSEVPVLTAMSPKPLVVNLTAIPADDRFVFADFSEQVTTTQ